jgi:hypothetical protein
MADGVRLHAGHLSAGTRKPVQRRSSASKLNIAAPLSAQRPEARSTPNTCISVIDSSESSGIYPALQNHGRRFPDVERSLQH